MCSVANKIKNNDFFFRLNSVPNAEDKVAYDVRYHLSCWTRRKKEVQRLESVVTDNEENIAQMLADIEISNLIE